MKWKSTIEALLINVSLNDADTVNEDDDIEVLELIVLPPNYTSTPEVACIKDIYAAMNTCADLHPDPNSSEAEDEEGEEDLSAPGATGWITAENMDEYLDEDGNFRGGITIMGGAAESLGPGAGTVRGREEVDEEHVNGVNGDGAGHPNKYHQTD
jgi:nucleotide-sensitive chloride channel 1A